MILDSTFLVDFEREKKRRRRGPACRFLEKHADISFCVTFTVVGELAAGRSMGKDRAAWSRFVQQFRNLESSPAIAWEFGSIYRFLQAKGTLIGANDLWIAATAMAHHLPLVTRNTREFERIPSLGVLGY